MDRVTMEKEEIEVKFPRLKDFNIEFADYHYKEGFGYCSEYDLDSEYEPQVKELEKALENKWNFFSDVPTI